MTEKRYAAIAAEIGELVESRAEQYGDSLGKCATIMRALYPDGISLEQMDYAGLVLRIVDKLCRVSNGHLPDSFADVAGYALRGEELYRRLALPKATLQYPGKVCKQCKMPLAYLESISVELCFRCRGQKWPPFA